MVLADQLLLQFLLAEHTGEEGAGEVTLGGARQDDDNRFPFELRLLGQTVGSDHGSAGADTGQDPFLFHQAAGHLDGFVTAHLLDAVQQAQIQVARDEAGADALDLVGTGLYLFTRQFLADDGDSLGSTATETMALPLVFLM